MSESTAGADLVLYVGLDRTDASGTRFCAGSRGALAIVEGCDALRSRLTVQSVEALRDAMVALPEWLRGTPTLVSRASRQAMRGSAAIRHLEALARHEETQRSADERSKTKEMRKSDPLMAAFVSLDDGESDGGAAMGVTSASDRMHLGAGDGGEGNDQFTPISAIQEEEALGGKITDEDVQRALERRKSPP